MTVSFLANQVSCRCTKIVVNRYEKIGTRKHVVVSHGARLGAVMSDLRILTAMLCLQMVQGTEYTFARLSCSLEGPQSYDTHETKVLAWLHHTSGSVFPSQGCTDSPWRNASTGFTLPFHDDFWTVLRTQGLWMQIKLAEHYKHRPTDGFPVHDHLVQPWYRRTVP